MSGASLVRFVPRPCVHERRSHRRNVHRSNAEWMECLDENGVPGFRSVAQAVRP